MQQRPKRSGDEDEAARRTGALMGFIVILLLAIAAVVLVRELRKKSILEDCLMSGRHNCAPIVGLTGSRRFLHATDDAVLRMARLARHDDPVVAQGGRGHRRR